MEPNYKLITDTESFDTFRALLKTSGLPTEDLNYTRDLLIGYYENDALVGTGGLEVHGSYALLRSLSVKLGIRGKSVGTMLTEYLIEEARKRKLKAIYLLTETARGFFQKKGFADVVRDAVPDEVKASSEFSRICPTSAIVMRLPLS
jgi:amino-acid N-acetyltransferase